ncbi:dTMP kinase [Candidatus Gottesmanbacteria bacterium RIFCSPLOWO2_02_FULL_42_29]|uniref:Thymidylate kinase n=2 Tax=Candidatus Gottesmaniibacteriota TaxID=1752720 RepID=A0A1F6BKB3_9BACT|nr:MAG: Thymidylate kinase [Candidatus Gottesmanbacteria bacterium GW2011_GWA2_42_18]OGG10818.1 MAG: dTMP kinase [Candidatus Gottesmanbacteria bacterium RIFCSPHIGHO2_01_FULL_42_27]OGG21393.1 MAG: dTMP kinase [Candidatus Gottesmanbacteria bacterium RIFCSPHIGHO2_12_FULL_43_26]OGG34068.1 MAG: dTMP kinase [Candidatus Gottesmanbacteria bacterium RIFCSPLOWO2_12_FULL_42_10]OGG37293.1 MAG: dTMP kinase [Candidatus Gottesmanbacteria bacterium RIFCSPLOWO2_01_FULL_42_22]OGG38676.1 MAG: dTMP kinase [Candid
MKKKNLFIVFEGLEGSGKSTQAGLLASRLLEEGFDIKATREPGGTRIGELIRQITHSKDNVDLTAVAESCLMAASRAQHVREIIRPALDSGKIVISDRFVDSSLAYQGYGRELGEGKITALNKMAVEEVIPDIVIFLDVLPEIGFKRRNGTSKIDRLDLQQNDFYLRVYEGYIKLAGKNKDKYFVVDSSKSIEEVSRVIWQKVKSLL